MYIYSAFLRNQHTIFFSFKIKHPVILPLRGIDRYRYIDLDIDTDFSIQFFSCVMCVNIHEKYMLDTYLNIMF